MPPPKQASIKSEQIERRLKRLLKSDPLLNPYAKIIRRRLSKVAALKTKLTGGEITLSDFASGHEYFGLHFKNNQWIFREWAPNAEQIFLIGDMTGWQEIEPFALNRLNEDGVWEIRLEAGQLKHLDLYRLRVHWRGGRGDRIPAYARRVVQDPTTFIFNAQIWFPDKPYQWRHGDFHPPNKAPLI